MTTGEQGLPRAAPALLGLAPVPLPLGLKTVVDLALHLWERRRAADSDPVPAE